MEPPCVFEKQRRRGDRRLWVQVGPWSRRRYSIPVRRLEISARGAGTEPQTRRRGAPGHPQPSAAFRYPPVRDLLQYRRPRVHVRQSDPARPARRRQDDHPGSGAQLGDRQGRQVLHVPSAPGRAVPRRRRADRGRREGHLRPHRQAAGRRQHPAQHPIPRGQRDHRAR